MAETVRNHTAIAAGPNASAPAARTRGSSYAVRITLVGRVQGVGFRPFVYRLAIEHGITGRVQNRLGEVDVVACGRPQALREFRRDLVGRAPPLSQPKIARQQPLDIVSPSSFVIIPSETESTARVFVPPDYFMCDDCARELADPDDRRYRYPFINCTQCGPRYTLINALPYDRPNTSMAGFRMCADCEAEYQNPADRRFHAEPIACPACGPELSFHASGVSPPSEGSAAIDAGLDALRHGGIVAVKGIGGYHLMCDARDEAAVTRLRDRKRRPDKPLAVMFPVSGPDGLGALRESVRLTAAEAKLVNSPTRPIVLAAKRSGSGLADNVAPKLSEFGVFLPYSPLHQLLLGEFGAPLVATSGNISGEPVLTDNDEAERRLAGVADAFLRHNRPIVRPADDPVFRYAAGAPRPIRVGRGTAPLELELPWRQPCPTLAVGGHMKGAIALSWDERIILSPHIGEMDSPRSLTVFERVINDLQSIYGISAERLVCDAHPGYTTHRWARGQTTLPVEPVWHHHAHASAVAAEFGGRGSWLVFTWDGVGLGEDGTLWGGEALLGTAGHWQRVASLRPFRLPGGDRAGREPWRSAAAMAWECGYDWRGLPDAADIAHDAWLKDLNCPTTTAAGRLFDAAAALILGQEVVTFEAAGPMLLESLCRKRREPIDLPLTRDADGVWRTDWEPLLEMLTNDSVDPVARAELFHASLAQAILAQARAVCSDHAVDRIGLGGGVFQNRVLAEQTLDLLSGDGFNACLPAALPVNDGGLCFGQAAELAARG